MSNIDFDKLTMTKSILKIIFTIQSIGISAVLLVGIWTQNIFGWTSTENALITAWITATIASCITYLGISLYKKLRHEED